MRKMRRRVIPWLLCASLGASLAGCGGSQQSFPAVSMVAPAEMVMGRVNLDRPIQGATVVLLDQTGSSLGLADAPTDATGFFLLRGAFPENFEAVATLPASFQGREPLRLTAQVRGDADTSEVVVNTVTHLVSLYLKAHPELTLEQAMERVKSFLEIPADHSIESLVDHAHSPFNHAVLLEEAAQAGGLELFFTQLLGELEAGQTHSFAVGAEEGGASFFAGLGGDIAKDAVKDQALSVVGWVGKGMGLNLGFTTSLDDLARKLDEISQQITELGNEIEHLSDQAAYTAARNALASGVVQPVQGASTTLQQAAQNRAANPVTAPVPYGTQNPDAQQVLSAVGPFLSNTYLDTLFNRLLGMAAVGGVNSRMERLLAPLVLKPAGLGNNTLSKFDGYPGRSVTLMSTARNMTEYYLNYADLAINLYAESAHASTNLATQIRNTQLAYHQTSFNKKLVEQQVPDEPASSLVYIDLEYGLMWYTVAQSKMTPENAAAWVRRFSGVGPYTDGWRLPVRSELDKLYENRIKKGHPPVSNKPATVLRLLGFDLTQMDDDHRVWYLDTVPDAKAGPKDNVFLPFHRYSLDTSRTYKQSDLEHNNFIVCRPLPGKAEKSYSLVPPLSHLTPRSLSVTQGTTSGEGRSVKLEASANCGPADANVPMTTEVAWKSSDDTMASVSNDAGSEGQLVWHYQPSGRALVAVTVTASFNERLNATLVVSPPAHVLGTLSSMQVSPYNVTFTALLPIQQPVSATLFYEDPVTLDRVVQDFLEVGAPAITWSLLDAQTGQPIPANQGGILGSTTPVIRLEPSITSKSLLIRAQSGNVTSDAPIFLP
jgi:hypothetical protein